MVCWRISKPDSQDIFYTSTYHIVVDVEGELESQIIKPLPRTPSADHGDEALGVSFLIRATFEVIGQLFIFSIRQFSAHVAVLAAHLNLLQHSLRSDNVCHVALLGFL